MTRSDWKLLQVPLIVLAAALLISAVVLSAASKYNEGLFTISTRLDSELQRAERRYNEARRDRSLYTQYLERYLEYSKKGLIGTEQRLHWIEQLQEINKDLKLASLRYEITPQTKVSLPGISLPKNVQINVSTMQLNAGLLHEGDGLLLLQRLNQNANGFFAVESCEMLSKINGPRLDYRPNTAYVDMACILNWYTVNVES